MRTLKQRLAEGERTPVFAVARLAHPLLIEMFGIVGGYRGFWVDQEHGSFNGDQLLSLAVAGRANQLDTFVRMAPLGYSQVTQCFEAGASGVMAAQIHSAAQAEEFVSWAKFPPRGVRGLNASGYDARYTTRPLIDFVQRANDETLVGIQVETLGALDQADAIAAIDGVDLLFIGPSDLSLSLGVPGQFQHERLWEAITSVAHACERHGKAWGGVLPDPAFAERALGLGCRMPSLGSDSNVVARGAAALKTAFAAAFAG